MSLSRAERTRRGGILSPGKWALLSFFFLLFVAVCFVLYIRSADSTYRIEERTAIREAKAQVALVSGIEATRFTWSETTWIVRGEDSGGTEWFIWLLKEGPVKKSAKEGIDEKSLRDRFRTATDGKRNPITVQPAWFEGQPAWEIRYQSLRDSNRQAIDFYAFADGTKLKTYELPGTS